MAASHQPSLEEFYFKQKRKQPPKKVLMREITKQDPTIKLDAIKPDVDLQEIQLLKAFDLDYAYGPAAGEIYKFKWYRTYLI